MADEEKAPEASAPHPDDAAMDAARQAAKDTKTLMSIAGGVLGILLFLAGIVLAIYWKEPRHWAVISLIITGNLLFAALLLWNREERHTSAMVRGVVAAYVVFLNAALFGGALVFVNLIAFNYARAPFDLTRSAAHTIDSQTVNILKGLERPIKILVVYGSRQVSRFTIEELLDLYRQHSSKIEVEYVDPTRDRTQWKELQRAYPDIAFPSVVVEYGTGEEADHVVLKDTDLFSISSDFEDARVMGGEAPTNKFKGEAAITSAIAQLTEGKTTVKVYFTIGYGQLDLNDSSPQSERGLGTAKNRMESLKWEVAELDLNKETEVPKDATVVIVPGPRQTLPAPWVQALGDYMDRGGRMILLADFEFDRVKEELVQTGLEDLLEKYDVQLGRTRILEAMRTIFGDVRVARQVVVEAANDTHPVAQGLSGIAIELPEARSVKPKGSAVPTMPGQPPSPQRYRATTLLSTGRNAWGESDLKGRQVSPNDPEDEKGPVPVAVTVSESTGGGMPQIPGHPPTQSREEPRMVVIGDAEFLSNPMYSQGSDAVLLNSVNWLRGRLDMLGIPPKEKKSLKLDADANPWGMAWRPGLVMINVLIIVGVGVWIVRNRF
jgi:ABC-type uncharacterized transport system involved in gliding motility auxiliary subunit